MRENEAELIRDEDLKSLLQSWATPDPSPTLDSRLTTAYRSVVSNATASLGPVIDPQRGSEVAKMKFCTTCQEEFADKFSFCPVDGTPLAVVPAAVVEPVVTPSAAAAVTGVGAGAVASAIPTYSSEYHLTIIEDAGLFSRLTSELRGVASDSQLTWPEFKRDPFGFTKRSVTAYGSAGWRFLTQRNVAIGAMTALLVVISVVTGIILLDRLQARKAEQLAQLQEDLELQQMIDIPEEQPTPEEGTAGAAKGNGGGSKPKQEKAGGGGGGGREEAKEASVGKLPQASLTVPQVVAPNPNPPVIKNPALPMPATLDADPVLFPPDTRPISYGDPKSKSTDPSSGSGRGNGIGTGTGGGVGSGSGGGVGPGEGGNTGGGSRNEGGGGPGGGGGGVDYNKVFRPGEVSQKARILSKPEALYTETARKNQIMGTVVLKVVFGANGQVTNIRAVSGLPDGLTEKAIAAAHQMKFIPATKDGHNVSMYAQLEYTFTIY
ncbi:MAG: periplasmic protein TonB [Blastocatellia bacterium]|jgi:TonB family protein|nr:periplasmic protein TonB [Blastocatellia bacterium]